MFFGDFNFTLRDRGSAGAVPVSLRARIDVWKYIRIILMGLGAFWKEKLTHPNRALCWEVSGAREVWC